MKITFASPSKNSVRKEEKTNGNCKLFVLYANTKKTRKAIAKLFCVIRKSRLVRLFDQSNF